MILKFGGKAGGHRLKIVGLRAVTAAQRLSSTILLTGPFALISKKRLLLRNFSLISRKRAVIKEKFLDKLKKSPLSGNIYLIIFCQGGKACKASSLNKGGKSSFDSYYSIGAKSKFIPSKAAE